MVGNSWVSQKFCFTENGISGVYFFHSEMCKFTFKNAAAQAFIFWMAGFESSATTMQFALYEMSKQPAIQDRVRKEIRRVMEKYDGDITYDGLMEMEYLGRVVHGWSHITLYDRYVLKTRALFYCRGVAEISTGDDSEQSMHEEVQNPRL